MDKNGVGSSAPLRTMWIVPAFSTTNSRPLPSLAGLASVGEARPPSTLSRRIAVSAGLKPAADGVAGFAVATGAGTVVDVARAVAGGASTVAVGAEGVCAGAALAAATIVF